MAVVPSGVLVTDRESLAQNFVENSVQVLCNAAFGAGAYAIGGRLVGAAALTPPSALLTAGALLAAMTFCPSGPQSGPLYGTGPQFIGGRCPKRYLFTCTITDKNGSITSGVTGNFFGPIDRIVAPYSEGFGSGGGVLINGNRGNGGFDAAFGSSDAPYVISGVAVRREDGNADDCGNGPSSGGQVLVNPQAGDTVDKTKVVNNQNKTFIIPVTFSLGGVNNTLNLNFGDIKIGSLLPINYSINIGGTRFGFEEQPDRTIKPRPVNPDPDEPEDKDETMRDIIRLLREVKECVCTPSVETESLILPLVDASVDCSVQTVSLEVIKDSVLPEVVQKFISSAILAQEGCNKLAPVQLDETLIFAATTLEDGRELFTGEIDTDVVSLRFKITSIDNASLKVLTLYPAAQQRKFGSVSFVTKSINGGGDYIYLFDTDSYIPLPKRGKKGKLRILLKSGVSFEVYDTGERF
jgi:hypothetical protein